MAGWSYFLGFAGDDRKWAFGRLGSTKSCTAICFGGGSKGGAWFFWMVEVAGISWEGGI